MEFQDCDVSSFYSSLSGNLKNRDRMHTLLKTMHRNVVPYTSSKPDVCDALMDVDGSGKQVHLIYKNTLTDATPHGTSDTWNREHLWPKTRGVGDSGPDFTDIHHLRPADWNVNAARGNDYFGRCGVVHDMEECTSPAHEEAAFDTETDSSTWLPPADVRGDIARALMYMAIRYDGEDDPDGNNLELSDCPDKDGTMGYLSQLLEWHDSDPVDGTEIQRNDAVCRYWQGNRNPFVDYPDLVTDYFGTPRSYTPGAGYACDPQVSTQTPISSASGGTCAGMTAGDVMLTGFQSQDPDVVVMVALTDIAAGAELFMTDNAWTGSSFKSNEGVKKIVVPDGGIEPGVIFGYGDDSLRHYRLWENVSGKFSLSTGGDNIFLYCLSSDGDPVHLSGLLYSGNDWSDSSDFTTSESALPQALPRNCALNLPHFDNYAYAGSRSGSRKDLLGELSTASRWTGSNDDGFDVISSQTAFRVSGASSGSGALGGGTVSMVCQMVLMVLLMRR